MAAWLGVCVGVEVGAPRWHALTPPASQLTEIYCSFALCRVSVSSKSPPQTSDRIWLHASRSRGDNKRLMGAGSRAGAASLGRAPCFRDTHQPQKTASNQHRTLLNPFSFFLLLSRVSVPDQQQRKVPAHINQPRGLSGLRSPFRAKRKPDTHKYLSKAGLST